MNENYDFKPRLPHWRLQWIGGESWHLTFDAARIEMKKLSMIRYAFPLTREPTMKERRKWYEKYKYTVAYDCLFLNGKIYATIEHFDVV